MKQVLFAFSISISILYSSCSDKNDQPPIPTVESIVISDVDNLGDGRDLEISFNKIADEDRITEYRVIIIKSSNVGSFTLAMALALTSDRYTTINADNSDKKFKLTQEARDSDGTKITEGQAYVAIVLTVGNSGNGELSKPSNSITLELPDTPTVDSITLRDITNFGDGRDINIAFIKVDENLITEYRIILVKSSVTSTFTVAMAEALPATNYTTVDKTGANVNRILTQTTRDSNGDLIVQNGQYNAFVLTTGLGRNQTQNKLSVASNLLTVEIPTAPTVSELVGVDVSNNANGKDIEVKFTKASNENMISVYRVIVVKSSASAINLTTAEGLNTDRYHVVPKTGSNLQQELRASLQDSDGDIIQESVNYKLLVMSMADGTVAGKNSLSSLSGTIRLEQKNAVRTFAVFPNAGTGGLQVDGNGNVFMGNFGLTDNGGGTEIFKITPEGTISTFATGLTTTDGNDMDSQGNLYAISWPTTIFKITPSGTKSVFATNSLINNPIGIVIDNNDNLFVTCYSGNNLVKITSGGVVSLFSTSSLYNGPNGIDMDAAGNIYVSNWNNGSVIKVDKNNGSAELFVNVPSVQKAHLVINNDIIYVAGRIANTIYKVTLAKQVSVFLGTGVRGDSNGPLSSATISWPNDLAFNANGTKMYISMVGLASPSQNIVSPAVIKEISLVE